MRTLVELLLSLAVCVSKISGRPDSALSPMVHVFGWAFSCWARETWFGLELMRPPIKNCGVVDWILEKPRGTVIVASWHLKQYQTARISVPLLRLLLYDLPSTPFYPLL